MDLQSYTAQPSTLSATLSLALARSNLMKNYTRGIITPLGSAVNGMGMPALPLSVMMDYYDQRAITPAVRQNYYNRLAEAGKTAARDYVPQSGTVDMAG